MEALKTETDIAEEFKNFKKSQIQPTAKHITQARTFHKVLCKKGFDSLDKACIIQALMDMSRGKL